MAEEAATPTPMDEVLSVAEGMDEDASPAIKCGTLGDFFPNAGLFTTGKKVKLPRTPKARVLALTPPSGMKELKFSAIDSGDWQEKAAEEEASVAAPMAMQKTTSAATTAKKDAKASSKQETRKEKASSKKDATSAMQKGEGIIQEGRRRHHTIRKR